MTHDQLIKLIEWHRDGGKVERRDKINFRAQWHPAFTNGVYIHPDFEYRKTGELKMANIKLCTTDEHFYPNEDGKSLGLYINGECIATWGRTLQTLDPAEDLHLIENILHKAYEQGKRDRSAEFNKLLNN